ncbi:MAG TPA: glutamine amidotransferase family protein [Nitrospiria bacterium]|nr:glutamine amidotransferase family protein [Nitrospiria bacterium]
MNHNYQKDISGCGVIGIINKKGKRFAGDIIKKGMCIMNDRGNGLGSGFAAYGIYPDYKECYALHVMYHNDSSFDTAEKYINKNYKLEKKEEIPISKIKEIGPAPHLLRYFVTPNRRKADNELQELPDDDFVVKTVMKINSESGGGYVFSSGKNMGTFKGVGYPKDIADFFQIERYEGYLWTSHNRFPTNTPGWWGGAHPLTLLDWSIIHNGEISSYGINKRYLEMFGYKLTLLTDTEVVAYLLDLLVRRHGMSIKLACLVLAVPFWKDIDALNGNEKKALTAIRQVYGSALLNGPFAFILGHTRGMVGLNDRVKLRPLVAGLKDDFAYMASEESAIREVCPNPEKVWAPKAGDPLIFSLDEEVYV